MKPSVERIRHELKFRIAEVVRCQRLTPRMARITLHHSDFAQFPSLAYDDHVKLFIPQAGVPLAMPMAGPNGLVWPEGAARPEGRDYTPRSFDQARQEVVIDFVLHGDGPASTWAARAQPGDRLGIGGPRGSFVVKGEFDYYLLVGDETALPAIGRRIEELPAGARVIAYIEIADAAERQAFATAATVEIHWLERAAGAPGLLAAIGAADLPDGRGYAFIAGESATSTAIRDHLVTDRNLDSDLIKAAGYWRRGEADHDDGHEH
ncbi:siderophore-interacting protein [Devosia sp. FKR38]|uniref:siderophore-interacting protein n=1 Tax=Devosia sp. FKR38 TaxID=2562312 RepID=UPI0010C118EC|nr:siderophore-interacting protein [Devosia sp. FKR38]